VSVSGGDPIKLDVTLKYGSPEEFDKGFAANVAPGTLFLRTPRPKVAGTQVLISLRLRDGTVVLGGGGVVIHSFKPGALPAGRQSGMLIEFNPANEQSAARIASILDRFGAGAHAQRPQEATADAAPPSPNLAASPAAPAPPSPVLGGENMSADLDNAFDSAFTGDLLTGAPPPQAASSAAPPPAIAPAPDTAPPSAAQLLLQDLQQDGLVLVGTGATAPSEVQQESALAQAPPEPEPPPAAPEQAQEGNGELARLALKQISVAAPPDPFDELAKLAASEMVTAAAPVDDAGADDLQPSPLEQPQPAVEPAPELAPEAPASEPLPAPPALFDSPVETALPAPPEDAPAAGDLFGTSGAILGEEPELAGSAGAIEPAEPPVTLGVEVEEEPEAPAALLAVEEEPSEEPPAAAEQPSGLPKLSEILAQTREKREKTREIELEGPEAHPDQLLAPLEQEIGADEPAADVELPAPLELPIDGGGLVVGELLDAPPELGLNEAGEIAADPKVRPAADVIPVSAGVTKIGFQSKSKSKPALDVDSSAPPEASDADTDLTGSPAPITYAGAKTSEEDVSELPAVEGVAVDEPAQLADVPAQAEPEQPSPAPTASPASSTSARRSGVLGLAAAVIIGLLIGGGAAALVKLFPSSPQEVRWLREANALARAGKSIQAIPLYERAIEADPELAIAYRHLAIAHAEAGHVEESELAFLRYLERAKDAADIHRIRQHLGLEQAAAIPDEADEVVPANADDTTDDGPAEEDTAVAEPAGGVDELEPTEEAE